MRAQLPFLERHHLKSKHKQMAQTGKSAAFRFLRGTFYLWSIRIREVLPELVAGSVPRVQGLGDVHIENFGTWRDKEGRLVWGANDIDEATSMPYTQDLIRLTTSAALALDAHIPELAEDVVNGYRSQLESGARAFVLAEADEHLWKLAREQTSNPRDWWQKLQEKLEPLPEEVQSDVMDILQASFPGTEVSQLSWHTRQAGMGSLGRPRIVVTGNWYGARICREAKAMLPSAWDWSSVTDQVAQPAERLLSSPYRASDPYAAIVDRWSIRRLAPDSDKIAIDVLQRSADQRLLLRDMGSELANIHLTDSAPDPLLQALPDDLDWLVDATKTMMRIVREDQERYAAAC